MYYFFYNIVRLERSFKKFFPKTVCPFIVYARFLNYVCVSVCVWECFQFLFVVFVCCIWANGERSPGFLWPGLLPSSCWHAEGAAQLCSPTTLTAECFPVSAGLGSKQGLEGLYIRLLMTGCYLQVSLSTGPRLVLWHILHWLLFDNYLGQHSWSCISIEWNNAAVSQGKWGTPAHPFHQNHSNYRHLIRD